METEIKQLIIILTVQSQLRVGATIMLKSQSTKSRKSKTASSRQNHSSNKTKQLNAVYAMVHPVHRETATISKPQFSYLEIIPTSPKQSFEGQTRLYM